MPIPIELCDPVADLCCDALIDDGDAILTAATAALFTCLGYDPEDTEECEPPFRVFMGWGAPAVAYPDYLTAWIESAFRTTLDQNSKGPVVKTFRVGWVVRLQLSGYPTFSKDVEIKNPDLAALDAANRVMMSLAANMMSTLSNVGINGCSKLTVERMDPAVGGGEVLGGTAGVSVRVAYTRII